VVVTANRPRAAAATANTKPTGGRAALRMRTQPRPLGAGYEYDGE
jgi:hypothetical protein